MYQTIFEEECPLCLGQGFYGIKENERRKNFYLKIKKENKPINGQYFVKCPICNGRGKLA